MELILLVLTLLSEILGELLEDRKVTLGFALILPPILIVQTVMLLLTLISLHLVLPLLQSPLASLLLPPLT